MRRSGRWAVTTAATALAAGGLLAPANAFAAGPVDAPGGSGTPFVAGPIGGPATVEASQAGLQTLLTRLHGLYQQAEAASQNATRLHGRLATEKKALASLNTRVTGVNQKISDQRQLLGLMARAQYQGGGISALEALITAEAPQDVADQAHVLAHSGAAQRDVLDGLKANQAALRRLKASVKAATARTSKLARQQTTAQHAAEKQLATVRGLVTKLTGAQRGELSALETKDAAKAQRAFLATHYLGDSSPSAAGRRALAYAFAQLGKPYVWGATGPDAFDCSGLTSQAWAHAGVTIPRVSQDQWSRLSHVPLDQIRPGDLVVYFSGATHVAMYVGDGQVIQAPRPGAFVDIVPIGSNPVLGAVRPDPGSPSDGPYHRPKLPPIAYAPQPFSTEKAEGPARQPADKPAGQAHGTHEKKAGSKKKGAAPAQHSDGPSASPSRRPSASASPSPRPSGSATDTASGSPTAPGGAPTSASASATATASPGSPSASPTGSPTND